MKLPITATARRGLFADDDEHKRARNMPEIVAALNDLKPRAELGRQSPARWCLLLGGDCVAERCDCSPARAAITSTSTYCGSTATRI